MSTPEGGGGNEDAPGEEREVRDRGRDGGSDAEAELEDLRPALTRVLPADWDQPIAARDQAALDAAVRRAWLVVYYRVAARTGDRGEAEEAAQEVFCRVLTRMGTRTGDEAVRKAYLARSASNLLQDQWRRRRHRRFADTAYAADPSGEPIDPQEAVVRRVEAEQLVAALRRLPPIQAQVLRLRIGEELSSEETGAVLGKSAAAVRQIQHRALEALRVLLDLPDGGDG